MLVTAEEKLRFEKICHQYEKNVPEPMGIGTLHEKPLHRILKTYFCPDTEFQEVGIGDFVADALVGNTIYEIQTAGLSPLRKKLRYYLDHTEKNIVVVCPAIVSKSLVWIHPETGVASSPRRTNPGHGKMRVLPELVYLLDCLDFERLSFCLVGVNVEDVKLLDGRGKEKKIGATRLTRIPHELISVDYLCSAEDIAAAFLPANLPDEFGSSDFSRRTNLRRLSLSAALKVLVRLGFLEIVGKKKNSIRYRVSQRYHTIVP